MTSSTALGTEAVAKTTPSLRQSSRAVNPDPSDGEIHVWPVQGNVSMLIRDGGNIAVQVGEQGALVVDSGAGKLTAAYAGLKARPATLLQR